MMEDYSVRTHQSNGGYHTNITHRDGTKEELLVTFDNPSFVRYATARAKQEYNRPEYRWDRYAGL